MFYDAFIEGAKEGFSTAVRIIPYLIAILVAIGVFRASGAMDWLIGGIPLVCGIDRGQCRLGGCVANSHHEASFWFWRARHDGRRDEYLWCGFLYWALELYFSRFNRYYILHLGRLFW